MSVGRGPYRALVDAERSEPADQAAEADRAAVRHHGVAEHRHEERGGAGTALREQAADDLVGHEILMIQIIDKVELILYHVWSWTSEPPPISKPTSRTDSTPGSRSSRATG